MYNIDFLPQLEAFSRDLFGDMPNSPALPFENVRSLARERARGHGLDDDLNYIPRAEAPEYPCHKNANGEWVPYASDDDSA